jgi:hypothetical protein
MCSISSLMQHLRLHFPDVIDQSIYISFKSFTLPCPLLESFWHSLSVQVLSQKPTATTILWSHAVYYIFALNIHGISSSGLHIQAMNGSSFMFSHARAFLFKCSYFVAGKGEAGNKKDRKRLIWCHNFTIYCSLYFSLFGSEQRLMMIIFVSADELLDWMTE